MKIKNILLFVVMTIPLIMQSSGYPSQPSTPVTPHNSRKKIVSFLRLSPQATWQENLAETIVQDPRIQCFKKSDTCMEIVGNFKVNERTWHVVKYVPEGNNHIIGAAYEHNFGGKYALVKMDDPIKNWIFSIEIEQLDNDKYALKVQNPNMKHVKALRRDLQPGQIWSCQLNNLAEDLSGLLSVLNPLNSGYGE